MTKNTFIGLMALVCIVFATMFGTLALESEHLSAVEFCFAVLCLAFSVAAIVLGVTFFYGIWTKLKD